MDNFIYHNTTKIVFGKGMENQIGQEVALFGKKILLHYGGGSIKKSGLYNKVTASLKAASVEYIELAGVQPNPRLSLVRQGIKLCKEQGIELVLAVGGGSVIDSAKAIGLGVKYAGDVWDFFSGKAEPKDTLPVATIVTIPAAGSESSISCVITNEDGWYKRGINFQILYPKVSILNPELAFSLPKYQIACGAADIFAHMLERYFTNTQNVELTDRLIEGGMKTVINNASALLKDSHNYEAWAQVMWAASLAHNNLLSTGRLGDWASHRIEHEVSGIYDVAHGAGLAVIIPAWMKYVYKHDVKRFAQFASRVWNVDYSVWDPEQTALEGIERMTAFFTVLGLPVTLSELAVPDDRLDEMADKCTAGGTATTGNFVKLAKADVRAILELAR